MSKVFSITLFILSVGLCTVLAQNNPQEKQKPTFYYNEETHTFEHVPETKKGVDSLLAISWNNRGSDIRKALGAAQLGLNLAESLQYESGIAQAHNLMGLSYQGLGSHEQALEHYLTSLDMYIKEGNKQARSSVLNNIAILYLRQENYNRSAKYFKRAIKQMKEVGDDQNRVGAVMNLGIVHYYMGEHKQALKYYKQALDILKGPVDSKSTKMLVYANMGNIYGELGEFEKGQDYLTEAITYFDRNGLVRNKSGSNIYLAKLYQRWGDNQQALEHAKRGLEQARDIGHKDFIKKGYKRLADIYEEQNNYQQAYNLYKQFKAVEDSLLNSQRSERINEMQIRFDVEQKNREIELLNKEAALKEAQLAKQKLWRNFLIIGLILFGIILGLLYRYSSQKKKANQLLEQKNQEIEQQNKQLVQLNEEKDEFLGIAAHDLRSPLSGIKSVTGMLKEEKNMPEQELQEYLDIIEISADRMVNLINNLLDVKAIERGDNRLDITTVDIKQPIKQAVSNFEKIAGEKEIELNTDIDPNSKPVMADEDATQRILDNLISNAIKYSPPNSNVKVTAEMQNNAMKLAVKDNGPGIPKEEQDKLFNRFSNLSTQPTNNESSTGLGLYIVKNLIEAMKGEVHCKSELGKGTEFSITLPAAK